MTATHLVTLAAVLAIAPALPGIANRTRSLLTGAGTVGWGAGCGAGFGKDGPVITSKSNSELGMRASFG